MAVVKVNGIEKTYPEGTTYLEIARDFQDQYENCLLYTSPSPRDA